MKEKQKGNRDHKRTGGKWGTGDLGDNDAELFKHLPNPQEFFKEEAARTKRKVKKDRG